MNKILVAAPIYEGMDYCFDEFLSALKNIDYLKFDILLVDNSKNKKFFHKLKKISEIKVLYDSRNASKRLFKLISSRNKILKYARNNNYNYVLMMDADVIPPKNILNELLKCKKDIVTGLYLRLVNDKFEANADRHITKEEFEKLKKDNLIQNHITESRMKNILFSLVDKDIKNGELIKVGFGSAGCMLLSKKAFSKLKYGYLGYGADDNYFFLKAEEKGFEIFCFPSVFCQHRINLQKKFIEGKHHLDM